MLLLLPMPYCHFPQQCSSAKAENSFAGGQKYVAMIKLKAEGFTCGRDHDGSEAVLLDLTMSYPSKTSKGQCHLEQINRNI